MSASQGNIPTILNTHVIRHSFEALRDLGILNVTTCDVSYSRGYRLVLKSYVLGSCTYGSELVDWILAIQLS